MSAAVCVLWIYLYIYIYIHLYIHILIEQIVVVMAGDDGSEQRTERTELKGFATIVSRPRLALGRMLVAAKAQSGRQSR